MYKYKSSGVKAIDTFNNYVSTAISSEAIDTFLSLQQRLPTHVAIRQFLIYHDGDLETTILVKFSNRFDILELINPTASVIHLSILNDDDTPITGLLAILPTSNPFLYRILSVSFSLFWNKVIRKLVKRLYPEAMPVYFRQAEIRDALISLEQKFGHNFKMRIADVTMKGKRGYHFYDTERLWTDLSISEIFEYATEHNLWFTSLRFIIQQQLKNSERFNIVSSGRIYNRGEVFYDFYHNEIVSYLMTILTDYSSERLKLLSKRGIRERNYKSGYPLEIFYKDNLFNDIEEIRRFGESIQNYQNATKAVFHSNPYYHASIADFLDGSSFEVWIVSPNRVILVPQARSSAQAFERLISHILFEFNEGRVDEYKGED